MNANVMIQGEYGGKPIIIPIETDIDLTDKNIEIHYENRKLKVLGKWDAIYVNDPELGDTAQYTPSKDTGLASALYSIWVVITDAGGTFIDKSGPTILDVQYAPTIPETGA